jgi:hypothetical protein
VLTEGSVSLTLVLVHPEGKLGYRSCARSAQAKENPSCESGQSIEGLLLQACTQLSDFNTRTWLRVVARSACKNILKKSES